MKYSVLQYSTFKYSAEIVVNKVFTVFFNVTVIDNDNIQVSNLQIRS
jgi:hypothetical protein